MLLLVLGGIAMLITRFQHTVTWAELAGSPERILPDVGQGIIAFGWLVGFPVVCSPALVKLLPRLPIGGRSLASRSITSYLREFLAPYRWPFGRESNAPLDWRQWE